MKRALFFWFSLLLAGSELLAQTQLVSYGSGWRYLDNGTDQGTAWRSLSFNDAAWKTGNGLFGYGKSDVVTTVGFGSNSKKKYITTYFRKIISLSELSNIVYFSAGVLRDDGIVVYVNGVEVYRNKMPVGSITYLTKASNADDNGDVTQTFTINTTAFVSGDNVIAVEIHQNNASTPDMAFDLQLAALADQTPPAVVSMLRQSPATQSTNASTVTFRAAFSEKIRGIDHSDFTLTTVSGTAGGTLLSGAVAAVGTDSVVYDVTVSNVQGDGTLRLDVNGSGTGITDTIGNAIAAGFNNGATYIVDRTAPLVQSILRQSPATQITSDSTIKFRITFSESVTGVDRNDFILTLVDGTAAGVLRHTAVMAVDTTGVIYDITVNAVQGNGTLRLDLNGSGTGIADVVGPGWHPIAMEVCLYVGATHLIQPGARR
ncbi:hypothetical protein [Niastella populi]|uniref:Bacterial Ig-like domain-containing protein n=1 Tax=Niastella populi TaxID=550983 RepID=A0A1V9FKW3_9BACT|nr:hypothetical protein [Niastella populi]OQP58866.1 hypothetical protein A4R26_22045 [Niastella populi]